MKLLVITNLYPPHLAGTFETRCETVVEGLKQRGHVIRVLTSNYGLKSEQRDPEVERRLQLNGGFDQPAVTGYGGLAALEKHNHRIFQETIREFEPDLLYAWSLHGLSKSLMFGFRHSRYPTVYDMGDSWLARELGDDPWLRWWNRPNVPHSAWRSVLEATGQRNKLDSTAPTRMMKGYERVPEVFGDPDVIQKVRPNSIAAFHFNRLYFASQFLKTQTENAGFQVSHGEVIHPGVATDLFYGEIKPQTAPIKKLLVVARLHAACGVATALEAVRQARESRVAVSLTVCGRGDSDYIAQLRSFVINHQLPVEFVTVSQQKKDLAALYRQHDAFLHTSEWEDPFVTSFLEAMACGLPVIATRSGGAAELLRHGQNALAFTPGDPLELGSRIHELQIQPVLRCQMAEVAQAEVANQFNHSLVLDQIENYLATSVEFWQHHS